jgi:hypothetical protein
MFDESYKLTSDKFDNLQMKKMFVSVVIECPRLCMPDTTANPPVIG